MRRNKMAVSLVTRLCLVTEQVRLCLMNKVRKEEKPRIPRQSHGTRRTMCGNTEREEQGAETRNEENDVWKHGTRIARCGDTEREEQGAETRNEKSKVRRHGTRRARCGDTEREEQDAEPRNEEKQDGSITRYEALPRNGTSQALHHE